jgi:serine/threonine protein kinase
MVELKKIEEMGIQQLFWEELSIVKRLKHPNIVSCFEYFRTTNNCYTIYEYCEGGDLTSLLKKGPLFDKEDLLQANAIIKDVFQGLLYL